jgi:guanyl-specific ribonuclease Sa
MKFRSVKTEIKESKAVANQLTANQGKSKPVSQDTENRPGLGFQRNIHQIISNSPRVKQPGILQAIADKRNSHSSQKKNTVYPLQGKFDGVQQLTPNKEEEKVQGKIDSVQQKANNAYSPDETKKTIVENRGYTIDDISEHYPATLTASKESSRQVTMKTTENGSSLNTPTTVQMEKPSSKSAALALTKDNISSKKGKQLPVGQRHFQIHGGVEVRSLMYKNVDHSAITFMEYDVNPKKEGENRDSERIVVGSDGRIFYTADHYQSFEEINN